MRALGWGAFLGVFGLSAKADSAFLTGDTWLLALVEAVAWAGGSCSGLDRSWSTCRRIVELLRSGSGMIVAQWPLQLFYVNVKCWPPNVTSGQSFGPNNPWMCRMEHF